MQLFDVQYWSWYKLSHFRWTLQTLVGCPFMVALILQSKPLMHLLLRGMHVAVDSTLMLEPR